MKNKDNQGL